MDTKKLIATVSNSLGRRPEDVASRLSMLCDIIMESIKEGDIVAVPGFGNFEPKLKMERVATHPSTGKKLLVPPKLSIVFKPSTILKQKVRK